MGESRAYEEIKSYPDRFKMFLPKLDPKRRGEIIKEIPNLSDLLTEVQATTSQQVSLLILILYISIFNK